MERKDYLDCLNSLLDAVQTLLDANNAMGELAMCKRDKKVERVQAPPIAHLHRNLQAPKESST